MREHRTEAAIKVSPTSLPKSVKIEQILRQRIRSEYQPGEVFSSEPKLSKEFQVSRTLIRGVLGNLAREGFFSRKARCGTFVSTQLGDKPEPEVSDLIERLLEYGPNMQVDVLEIKTTLGEVGLKTRLRLAVADPLVAVKRLIYYYEQPLTYLVSLVPYEIVRNLEAEDIEKTPVTTLLRQRKNIPIERAAQTIEPAVADIEVASHLKVNVGPPILLVERFLHGRRSLPIYCSQAFYRGDRYKFTVGLQLGRGNGAGRRSPGSRS